MKAIYFDNAATTRPLPEVLASAYHYNWRCYGNPSSAHLFGTDARVGLNTARRQVATALNCSPQEIIFNSGGTEGNNTIIKRAVKDLGITRIISSPSEHHCVLNSLEAVKKDNGVDVILLPIDKDGRICYDMLGKFLQERPRETLVTLMHANNEIGTLIDLYKISNLCKQVGAYFHSDTVQTIGYFPFDLNKLHIHFLTGSGHKFHATKGTGFIYINKCIKINPYLNGGDQEQSLRGGTENVAGIVGLGIALEVASNNLNSNIAHIRMLKNYAINELQSNFKGIEFNGDISESGSNCKVLSILLPKEWGYKNVLTRLHEFGIAVAGRSACSTSHDEPSHVLDAIGADQRRTIRLSFNKYNTTQEIDEFIDALFKISA